MKAKTGACEGVKPYGYFEGEQGTFERMNALRASGATYAAIADTLNSEGIEPRRAGTKFHAGYVHGLLTRLSGAPASL